MCTEYQMKVQMFMQRSGIMEDECLLEVLASNVLH